MVMVQYHRIMHIVYENHLIQSRSVKEGTRKKITLNLVQVKIIILSFKTDSIGFALRLLTLIVKVRLFQNDFDCGLQSGIMKRTGNGSFFCRRLLHVRTVITVVVSCRFVRYNVQYLQSR